MTEIKDTIQKYQWVQGDKVGKVETIAGEDGEFTLFEGGGRIYTNLIGEFMTPLGPNGETFIDENPYEESIPVNQSGQSHPSNGQGHARQTPNTLPDSAIMQLLKKMKSPVEREFNVTVKVKVPNDSMFNVLKDSFGEELDKEIQNFIIDQIDNSKIRESVNDVVKDILKEYIS